MNRWDDSEFCDRREASMRMRECSKLPLQPASSIPDDPTVWIYQNWLVQNELTLLVGPPGAGKTTLYCALAAGVTRGGSYQLFPGVSPTDSGLVVIISNEDNISRTLKPRLRVAGADMDKVHIYNSNIHINEKLPFSFSNDQHIDRFLGFSEANGGNLRLIIIDPIYFAVDGDFNNNFKADVAYRRLTKLANRLNCAILGVAHSVRNPRDKDPLSRVAGTPALRQVPRTVMFMNKIADGPTENGGTHILVHVKNNIGRMDGGFEYHIVEGETVDENGTTVKAAKFEPTEELFGSPEELLSNSDRHIEKVKERKHSIAVEFLQKVLNGKSLSRREIDELAIKAGIKNGTLINAKTFLKIKTDKRKGDGQSVWSLPNSEFDVDKTI